MGSRVRCGSSPERVGQLQGKETTPGRHLSVKKTDSQKQKKTCNMTKSKQNSNHLPNRKEWFDMVENGGFFGSSS